ncbi:MAG: hypothetical protein KDB22_00345 [Planctomycetales bacterium]|nr:hypothetical protein [Planctomycetales bacterium]
MIIDSAVFGVFVLPLLAAILFAMAAVSLRLTAKHRIDVWRVSFVSNVVTALAFQPLWFACEGLPPFFLWWQPMLVAVLFVAGQILTLVSLTKGDISVAAPVLGLKLIFVPLFLALLGIASVPSRIWVACLLSAVALMLLNYSEGTGNRARALFSAITAAMGAGAFAMFDVCVQLWSQAWNQGGFLPLTFLCSIGMSWVMIPMFESKLRSLPRHAWAPLAGAAIFFALQAMAIVGSVAFWGQAAAANVVYSSRGLWSLILIAVLGSWLGVPEKGLLPRVFAVRLTGACALIAAIVTLAFDRN